MSTVSWRFQERLRVRWVEVDAQKIVFNGHYPMYFDTAVAGYWRALAMPYEQTMGLLDGDLYVRKATLEYEASARYDELLDIGMRCARVGTTSLTFEGHASRRGQRLVACELVYVFADPRSQRSKPVPAALRSALQAFEDGLPMLDVRVGGWQDLGSHAGPLRAAVWVQEHHMGAHCAGDEADADAVHAVAFNRFGQPLATGRVARLAPGVCEIAHLCVVAGLRDSGVGSQVLRALIDLARRRGDHEIRLCSRAAAQRFCERAGFVVVGTAVELNGVVQLELVLRC